MQRGRFHRCRAALALITAVAFLCACTHQVERPEVDVRHFAVDWEHAGVAPLLVDGLTVQGLVLTPVQWPMESSLKRLLQGDFMGVFDALDWRFHPSTVPGGILEDMYKRGFLPAYVRVVNGQGEPRALIPERLTLQVQGGQVGSALVGGGQAGVGQNSTQLEAPIPPEALPGAFSEVDWEQTALNLVTVALLVAVVVAGRNNRGNVSGDIFVRGPGRVYVGGNYARGGVYVEGTMPYPGSTGSAAGDAGVLAPRDRGLLRAGMLAPGEEREGVLFFRVPHGLVDWQTAKLVGP